MLSFTYLYVIMWVRWYKNNGLATYNNLFLAPNNIMAELTPYKPGRSQMGIDLLKAINEPSFTAQDLARQEEQARVEKFGGIRMPTQMENVWKGMEMATGIQPFGDQSKLDRAMMAAEMLAPGIKGKAMMPAMVPALGAIMRPGKWYKGWRNRDEFSLDQHIPREPRSVHSMGPHVATESDVAQGFATGKHGWSTKGGEPVQLNSPQVDFSLERQYPEGTGVMSQVELKGKGRKIPLKREGGDYIDDYEQIGRDVANFVFDDPKIGKVAFWDYMKNSGYGKIGSKSEADSIWERLRAFKGGFVTEGGDLKGKNFLKDKLSEIDGEIALIKSWPAGIKKQKYSFLQRKNIDLTPAEVKEHQSVLIQDLKRQRKIVRDHWKNRYVRDFGEYLKKSRQADKSFDTMAKHEYMDFYKSKLADDGVTHVLYKNTNPDEYMDWNTRVPTKGGGDKSRRMNRDTAMVLDMDAIKESWGK